MQNPGLIDVLGGQKIVHHKLTTDTDLFNLVKEGIPKLAVENLAQMMRLSNLNFVENYLGISYRTFRRLADTDSLSSLESERVVLLAKLYQKGIEVFDGEVDDFFKWWEVPCPGLGDKTPKELSSNLIGVDMILAQLNRMEYGIYG